MKSKLLLALATWIFAMTTFAANGAYADMTSGMPAQTQSRWCSTDGSNAFDLNCAGNIGISTEREGKAAYGEPREEKMELRGARSHFCSSEGSTPLDPKCEDTRN